MTDERLKLAVFIDFDNIEIGVKTTLGGQFDVGAVLEAVKEYATLGEICGTLRETFGEYKPPSIF